MKLTFKEFLAEADYDYKGILYVYDSADPEVVELDTRDELAMQRFSNKYGFHSDSLWDIPEDKGVRTFEVKGRLIFVSDNPMALAAEVEKQGLNEAIDPERKRALDAAMKQIEKQYGKGSYHDPEVRKKREERQAKSREKYREYNKKRDAEHARRMKDDPKYRAAEEKKRKESEAFWKSYGERRAAKDPSIVSKDGWTGD